MSSKTSSTAKWKASKSSGLESSSEFDGLAAPTRRALAAAGYSKLSQLAQARETEIASLHGMGPNAMKLLHRMLNAKGMSFDRRK